MAGSSDTLVTDAFTGLPMRTLRNRFASDYAADGAPVLPAMLQSSAAEDIFSAAAQRSDREYYPMPAGQSAGLIGNTQSAADIVRTLVDEARSALRALESLKV